MESKAGQMEAGRKIDQLVAEKVMGWTPEPDDWVTLGYVRVDHEAETETFERASVITSAPHYSTDIAAAWLVVEKLHVLFPELTLEIGWSRESHSWFCQDYDGMNFDARGDTPMLAICRAALKAIETLEA